MEEEMSGVRRPLLALLVAVTVVALMAAAAFTPRAAAQGGSDNSCGASNPNIGAFPPNVFNKQDSGEFETCGFRNNPNFEEGTFPPGVSRTSGNAAVRETANHRGRRGRSGIRARPL